jgi:hypothetical protein
MYEDRLATGLAEVHARLERARARRGGGGAVSIVAVTKGHPPAAVRAAASAGLGVVGENRVQELVEKREVLVDLPLEWHLIGHLQRNKVRQALPLWSLLHSLDSMRLARAVSGEAVRAGTETRVLVQVNASGEDAKGGLDLYADEGRVLAEVAEVAALPGLRVEGLMTMAPFVDDEAVLRPVFARTRAFFERCGREVPEFRALHLSMGMTNDFDLAVEEGSTMVRLGTILFGERSR